jgi:hypothetical protein
MPNGVIQRKLPGASWNSGSGGGIVIASTNGELGGALLTKIVSGIVKTGSVELIAGHGVPAPGPRRSTEANWAPAPPESPSRASSERLVSLHNRGDGLENKVRLLYSYPGWLVRRREEQRPAS